MKGAIAKAEELAKENSPTLYPWPVHQSSQSGRSSCHNCPGEIWADTDGKSRYFLSLEWELVEPSHRHREGLKSYNRRFELSVWNLRPPPVITQGRLDLTKFRALALDLFGYSQYRHSR